MEDDRRKVRKTLVCEENMPGEYANGEYRTRTGGLCGAIAALYQLS